MKKKVKISYGWFAKGLFALVFLLMISTIGFTQGVAINTTLAPANASAGLDIDFATKGFLISRVALTGTGNSAPLTMHVAGMIVYNTAKIGDVTPGLYYNDGLKWVPLFIQAGNLPGDMQYWNGTVWVLIPAGVPGQMLKLIAGVPTWSN